MATCLDAAGAPYPTEHNNHPITPLEGKSLLPAFANQPIHRDAIYFEHEGNRAIRLGKWKLVAKGASSPWELYNMETDRTETTNLASQYPQQTQKMARMWIDWAKRSGALPWPWSKNNELQ